MAITWHTPISKTYTYKNMARLGHEFTQSPSTVGASTTSVTVTLKLYVQTTDAVSDSSNTLTWSGSFGSGTASVAINTTALGGGRWGTQNIVLLRTLTRTVTPSTVSKITSSFSANLSGLSRIPGTMYASGSTTTGTRPVSAPAAPTGAKVTRVSDSQHTVSWTPTNPASTTAPYQAQVLQRWDNIAGTYTTIASLAGSTTSYTDRSTQAGRRYRWRAAAKNSGGQSEWVYSQLVYTTPAAPATVSAHRVGSDIQVSWPSPGGGSWYTPTPRVAPLTTTGDIDYNAVVDLPAGTTTWTAKTPDATRQWAYAVQWKGVNDGTGDVWSPWTTSNAVQLLQPPAAPSQLAPSTIEATQPATLSWRHNPLDSSDQTAYELRWRRNGTTSWTTVPKTASTQSSHTLTGLEPGPALEWQVRTWGAHTTSSPWSPLALTRVAEKPSVTIVSPTGGTLTASTTMVDWEFFDPEGEGQAAYRVTIFDGTGGQVWAGGGRTATSATPPFRLQDDTDYRIMVEARAHSGLWADPVEVTVSVDYAAPPTAALSAEWDTDTGTMVLTISHPEPTAAEVPAVSCELWRSTDGGDWLRIASGLPLDTVVTDPIVATGVPTSYKVVTQSALPSTAETTPVTTAPDGRGWVFLNAGPGWSQMVKVRDNARLSVSWDRSAALHHMAGRARPISVRGEQTTHTIGVSARLAPNPDGGATWRELRDFVANAEEPICYRDPKGHRLFVALNSVSGSHERRLESGSFEVTEIDFDEQEAPA